MTNNNMTLTNKNVPSSRGIGSTEQALLDRIPIPLLKKFATKVVLTKLRLQFTGWLQYIPFAILSLVLFLLAATARYLGFLSVAVALVYIASAVFIVLVYDLITVKFKIRPQERLPKRNDDLDLFDLMRLRRSCRSFQTRKMTPEHYDELIASVQFHSGSPMIGTAPVRFEYIAAPLKVWPTVNATEFLVAIAPKEYNRTAVMDVGRTLQKIVMDATRMGLATCWIGPGADHASITQQLGESFNPEKDHIICVCAVGYKSSFTPLFVHGFNRLFGRRQPLQTLFFADSQFEESLDMQAYPFNRFGRTFEICQWAPSSYNGQTTRCAAVTETDGKDGNQPNLKRFDFYAAVSSMYYAPVAVGIWYANWEMGCQEQNISGHFEILSEKELGIQNQLQLPRYDMSWVLDEGI